MTGKVLVTRQIFDEALALLRRRFAVDAAADEAGWPRPELLARASRVHGVLAFLTDHLDEDFMDRCPDLRVIANCAVGFNNIDLEAATRRGVLVTNTPGVLTETTADFTWALMLAAARRVVEADRFVREGRFTAWSPAAFLGHDVSGKVLGIVGFGRIGRAVARRAQGFGMKVLVHHSHPLPAGDGSGEAAPLDRLCAESDFISLHVPLTPGTRHLLDEAAFSRMKASCIVVNTSRGPVIDEKALVRALASGRIAAAGLDVYEREPEIEPALLELPNVVLAPHIGSASLETRRRMALMAAENLVEGLAGRRPPHLVNGEVWEQRRRA